MVRLGLEPGQLADQQTGRATNLHCYIAYNIATGQPCDSVDHMTFRCARDPWLVSLSGKFPFLLPPTPVTYDIPMCERSLVGVPVGQISFSAPPPPSPVTFCGSLWVCSWAASCKGTSMAV